MRVRQSIDNPHHSLHLSLLEVYLRALEVAPDIREVLHQFLSANVVAEGLSLELQLPALSLPPRHDFENMTVYCIPL